MQFVSSFAFLIFEKKPVDTASVFATGNTRDNLSSRNLFANEILKSLAYFRLNLPFFLNVLYIKSADNPADFYTRYI